MVPESAAALLVVSVGFCVAVAAAAGDAGPSGPYARYTVWQGQIGCQASVAAQATGEACEGINPSTRTRFAEPLQPGLYGLVIALRYDRTGALQGGTSEALRLSFDPPIDAANTTAWELSSGQRLLLAPIREPIARNGGIVAITVGVPRADGQPHVFYDQPFELHVSAFYGFAPDPDYSGLTTPPDPPAPESAPVGNPVGAPSSSPGSRSLAAASATVAGAAGIAGLSLVHPRVRRAAGVLVALFTRLDEDGVLSHPRRAELMRLVRADPGLPLEEARVRCGLAVGVFEYHAGVLERRRLLVRAPSDGRLCLWPGPRPPTDRSPLMPIKRRILDAVAAAPGQRQVDLAHQLGVPERTLRYHVITLSREQRLRLVSDGAAVRCYPWPGAATGPRGSPRPTPDAPAWPTG